MSVPTRSSLRNGLKEEGAQKGVIEGDAVEEGVSEADGVTVDVDEHGVNGIPRAYTLESDELT